MTKKLLRGLTDTAHAVAAELGATLVEVDATNHKHVRIRFRRADGREVTATAAKTPRSDDKSTLNFARQQYRRVITNSP